MTTSVEVAKYAQGHFRYFLFNKSHCAKIASRVAADLCTCAIWFLKACWKTTFYWICGYFRNLASYRKKFFIKTSPFHKRNISAKYFFSHAKNIFAHKKVFYKNFPISQKEHQCKIFFSHVRNIFAHKTLQNQILRKKIADSKNVSCMSLWW